MCDQFVDRIKQNSGYSVLGYIDELSGDHPTQLINDELCDHAEQYSTKLGRILTDFLFVNVSTSK